MEKFPKLQHEQVALLQAQHSTGIVLNENFVYANDLGKQDEKVYLIFENLSKAKEYIDSKISGLVDVEFVVYSNSEEVIIYIPPPSSIFSEVRNI